jgi:hypothetical protein
MKHTNCERLFECGSGSGSGSGSGKSTYSSEKERAVRFGAMGTTVCDSGSGSDGGMKL